MFTDMRFHSQQQPGQYIDYLFYEPEHTQPIPLLIYLPGAGDRGSDLRQIGHGGPIRELREGRQIPARVLTPQCRFETWFDIFQVLCEFVRSAIDDPGIDPSRVYVTGASMGAYATWQLCISHPDWFTAAVPVCGGGMYWDAGRLKDLPIWAFHGEKDDVVLPCESQHMVEAVNRCGGNARLTLFPEADHNAWDPAYSHEPMWQWLFSQTK